MYLVLSFCPCDVLSCDVLSCDAMSGSPTVPPHFTQHFLIEWNLFIKSRYDLFSRLHPILASKGLLNLQNDKKKLLLYGNDTLSDDQNNEVLSATITFIHNSKRFDHTVE